MIIFVTNFGVRTVCCQSLMYYSFDFEQYMVENWFSSSTKREGINHSCAVLLFHRGVVKNFNPQVLVWFYSEHTTLSISWVLFDFLSVN